MFCESVTQPFLPTVEPLSEYSSGLHINDVLPREVILRIFSFLDHVSLCRCSQVSKYWYELAVDGSNWQRVDLKDFQKDVEGAVLESIAKRAVGFLRVLNLENCRLIVDKNIRTLTTFCMHLESINLKECHKLTDNSLRALARNCKRLRYLDITSCSLFTDDGIQLISSQCLLMENLNISWCLKITDNGIKAIVTNLSQLTTFKCEGCTHMNNVAASAFSGSAQNLTVLDLNRCSSLSDEGFCHIVEVCTSLQTLVIANCISLTDESLIAIGHNCHELRRFDATCCSLFTDNGFAVLARGCHLLEILDVEDCFNITDETLRQLSNNCPNLQCLPKISCLEKSSVFDSSFIDYYRRKNSPNSLLETQDTLSRCELISDAGIRCLLRPYTTLRNMRVLELDNCSLISDATLNLLSECENLQRLDLFDCHKVTKTTVEKLEAKLPNLKVHIYFTPNVASQSTNHGRRRNCRCCVIL